MSQKTENLLLALIPSLIWGSTWYVIKFQIGKVDPILSVSYRYILSGGIMFLIMFTQRKNMRFSVKDHVLFLVQGACLFGFNYWMVYIAEQVLTSGLIAVIFSLIVFFNIFFGRIILKNRVRKEVMLGAVIAIFGTYLVFYKEIHFMSDSDGTFISMVYCFIGVILASLGNVLSAFIQRRKVPVLQANTYGMMYGGIIIFLLALILNTELTFDTSNHYLVSLIYLSLFGSIVAFGAYLTVIGRIGPEKAAYVIVFIPVISMIISSIFENYQWHISALIGLPVLVAGNYLGLTKKKIFKS